MLKKMPEKIDMRLLNSMLHFYLDLKRTLSSEKYSLTYSSNKSFFRYEEEIIYKGYHYMS